MKFRDAWEAAEMLAPDWKPAARQKARQRRQMPHRWQLKIEREARKRGITLPPDIFETGTA